MVAERAVLRLNAEMIQEGARQTNLFCTTNSKCGPAPSALIKLIKLMGITLPPQDELRLSRVDEVKHSHVLEQLNLPPSVRPSGQTDAVGPEQGDPGATARK